MSQLTSFNDKFAKFIDERKITNSYNGEFYAHIPAFISPVRNPNIFEIVYNELCPLVGSYGGLINGIRVEIGRRSCKFVDVAEKDRLEALDKAVLQKSWMKYDPIVLQSWSSSPTINLIKEFIEKHFDDKFDYCLAHIYRNQKDNIGFHSDSEAGGTAVASLSLGATRQFQFKPFYAKKGAPIHQQFSLESGDLVYMKEGCQRVFKHSVPAEITELGPRINLTFRKIVQIY